MRRSNKIATHWIRRTQSHNWKQLALHLQQVRHVEPSLAGPFYALERCPHNLVNKRHRVNRHVHLPLTVTVVSFQITSIFSGTTVTHAVSPETGGGYSAVAYLFHIHSLTSTSFFRKELVHRLDNRYDLQRKDAEHLHSFLLRLFLRIAFQGHSCTLAE